MKKEQGVKDQKFKGNTVKIFTFAEIMKDRVLYKIVSESAGGKGENKNT